MLRMLTLGTLLLGQALAVESLRVGDHVLLTDTALVGDRFLAPAFLTGAWGGRVPRSPWLGRPITITAETPTAYGLSGDAGQVWLPRRNLGAKAAFLLTRDAETVALAARLNGKNVWHFGRWEVPCEIVDGFHALLTLKGARVADVWRMQGSGLNVSPRGGLVPGDVLLNERVTDQAVLVVLNKPQGLKGQGASYGGTAFQGHERQIMAQAPARCTTLPAIYANAADVDRNLSLTRPPAPPSLPGDPDAQERALVGWTREQVYALYGSPNEPGTRADLDRLPTWTYGEVAYARIRVDFGLPGRVVRAAIARSP